LQRLAYAKGESDAVAKINGTFMEKDKKERQKHNKQERGGSYNVPPGILITKPFGVSGDICRQYP
jgi:hypothetical protein